MTPDSFSDGGLYADPASAIKRGRDMVSEGADIVDVGGESTRPGAEPVLVDEEIKRVVPVIEALAHDVRVSIDTRKAEVARAALAAGATIVNDISASLATVAAEAGAGWIAMHMQGAPQTMQQSPSYTDVVADVSDYLFKRAEDAKFAGVTELWIDPGVGFGKTFAHNLSLLQHLDVLTSSPWNVAIGTSRKSFLGTIRRTASSGSDPVNRKSGNEVDDRLVESVASALWSVNQGVSMVRVHDVAETARAITIFNAINEAA